VTDWMFTGLEDDVRLRMFEAAASGRTYALATIVDADGGPRPVGSQMVITTDEAWGFLSGGCIEADVALHGREVMAQGSPRRLVYGRGSPFIDMRLPCGGRLEVMVERLHCGDVSDWRSSERTRSRWQSPPSAAALDGKQY
jgi:xanthine dehydrogenase accessory factor